MNICDINPHIRYAERIFVKTMPETVRVRDCRIFSVLSGKAELYIDNQQFLLEKNAFFFCCSGSTYSINAPDGLSLFSLNFDLTQENNEVVVPYLTVKEEESGFKEIINRDIIGDCSLLNSYVYINDGSYFQIAVKNIIKEFSAKRIYFMEKSSAMLKDLLIDLYRKKPEKSDNTSEAVNKVIAYIKTNFSKKLTNKELAAIAGYHEYHLNRLFLRYTGTSMHKYILQMRIDEAKRLIMNTEESISSIADETGFSSKTHFTSYFKQSLGISPSEYRIKFKNNI